jgi:hypothetical protein
METTMTVDSNKPFQIVTGFLLVLMFGFWLLHAYSALQKDDSTDDITAPEAQSALLAR